MILKVEYSSYLDKTRTFKVRFKIARCEELIKMKIHPDFPRDSYTERQLIDSDSTKKLMNPKFLYFFDGKLEESYKSNMLFAHNSKFSIAETETRHSYEFSLLALLIIYSLTYTFSYKTLDSPTPDSLKFELILLNGSGLLLLLSYTLIQKNHLKSIRFSVLLTAHLSLSISLILNNGPTQSLIFNSNPPTLSCVLGLILLQASSKFITTFTFFQHLLLNLLTSILYLILHLLSPQDLQLTLLEFSILIVFTALDSYKFYRLEQTSREKYLQFQTSIPSKPIEAMTQLEGISSNLQEALELLEKASAKSSQSVALSHVHDILLQIQQVLATKKNIYEVDVEGIIEGLDADDKAFMKELVTINNNSSLINPKTDVRATTELPKRYQVEELLGVLRQAGNNWNFDMFFLTECTSGKPTSTLGRYVINKYRLDDTFHISESLASRYFERLENAYKANPYHNATHAADVLCSFLYILHQSILFESASDYEILACIIANLGHDVGHPGFTNRFLVNVRDPLAITCKLYIDNDLSVLEMMHAAQTFRIMQDPDCDLLQFLETGMYLSVRAQVVEMILATDMSKHFDLIGKLKAKLVSSPNRPVDTPEHRLEILKIAIKAADVAHSAKSKELHLRWSGLVIEEFYRQGDLEKEKGLPVSMYCDRDKTDTSKSQSGFIKNIVLPIYESLNNYVASEVIEKQCIQQLRSNQGHWESMFSRKRLQTVIPESPNERLKELKRQGTDLRITSG